MLHSSAVVGHSAVCESRSLERIKIGGEDPILRTRSHIAGSTEIKMTKWIE
jgi:hypothetical protein